MIEKIILALDGMDKETIFKKLENQFSTIQTIKIGLELYTRYGNDLITELYGQFKKDIFLDLKLHDIPTTVEKAIQSISNLPIKFLTIHLNGGEKMITQALMQASKSLPNTRLLGVTLLTSLEKAEIEQLYNNDFKSVFLKYLELAIKTKIPGIICSPNELNLIHTYLDKYNDKKSKKLLKICPGIRFPEDLKNDQSRSATPKQAFKSGADFLVIGRALTLANDQTLKMKLKSIKQCCTR